MYIFRYSKHFSSCARDEVRVACRFSVKCLLLLSTYNQIWNMSTNFVILSSIGSHKNTVKYLWSYPLLTPKCHVSGVPWIVITGSGLDDCIYWHLPLQSLVQSITTAHNRWLPNTRSISSWTTSVFSSVVTDCSSFTIWSPLQLPLSAG
jgi:hypothetical protein